MPFEGKARTQNKNPNVTRNQPRDKIPSPLPPQGPTPEASSTKQIDEELANLKRQNQLLEEQLKDLQTAWDADNESVLSSPPSAHNSKPASSVCSDQTSALNTEQDLNLCLSLEEGASLHNHSSTEN